MRRHGFLFDSGDSQGKSGNKEINRAIIALIGTIQFQLKTWSGIECSKAIPECFRPMRTHLPVRGRVKYCKQED